MTKSIYNKITNALKEGADPEKGRFLQRFFKTGPGEYGEGDVFIGLSVPVQRKIARMFFREAAMDDIERLLKDPIHEYRLTAIFILVLKFEKTREEKERKKVVDFYLSHTGFINNWDLVDSSAEKILGSWLFDKNRSLIYELAESENLWEQRIAVIATFYFIKKNQFKEALGIIEKLLNHPHDLIHKACGWMLREIGKRDFNKAYNFLAHYYKTMPRTMLRYAIEKFEPGLRKDFLEGRV